MKHIVEGYLAHESQVAEPGDYFTTCVGRTSVPWRWPEATARSRFADGQTRRRAGKRGKADVVMAQALDVVAALGSVTYVARCERELRAGGVPTSRHARHVDDLMPHERAVSDLVPSGLTGRPRPSSTPRPRPCRATSRASTRSSASAREFAVRHRPAPDET